MPTPSYDLWRTEYYTPTPEEDRLSRPTDPHLLSGYWRIVGARTKPDWPVAIWTKEGAEHTIFQIGRKVMNTAEHGTEWEEFTVGGWLKCIAVSENDWHMALESGRWDDGKPARTISKEEEHDIIPSTPADEGGNMIFDEETGEEVDDFWLQIKTKLAALAKKAGALGKVTTIKGKGVLRVTTLAEAEAAAKLRDDIREIGGLGEKRRKEEKKPHDDAAKAVQEKWVPVLAPASELAEALLNGIAAFQAAEEARLAEEARKQREAEEKRIREEREAELRREAEERAAEAAKAGESPPVIDDEQIAAQAAEEAAEEAAEIVGEAPKVEVRGSAYGRATRKAKTRTATITDAMALAKHLLDANDTDLLEYLQKRADGAARAKITLPGMEIDE